MAWRQGSIDDQDKHEGARARKWYKRDEREHARSMMSKHALCVRTYVHGLRSSAHGCVTA